MCSRWARTTSTGEMRRARTAAAISVAVQAIGPGMEISS
jgi:hypothetical protein